MREQDILQAVMQDAKIGWWQADMTRREFRMSDMVQTLLGVDTDAISFDLLWRYIAEPDLLCSFTEIKLFSCEFPRERPISIVTTQGILWFSWKVIKKEKTLDGRTVSIGYIHQVAQPDSIALRPGAERVDDLLFRLNSISHSFLALLNANTMSDALHNVLHELLLTFGGGRAYIVNLDWERRLHNCLYEVTVDGVSSERDMINNISMDDTIWWTGRIDSGLSVILSDLNELPKEAVCERQILESQGIKSMIVMPLLTRDKVRGYVGVDIVDHHHVWSNIDSQWFASLVNIISLCMELYNSEQTANEERDYIERLYRHMPLGFMRLRYAYAADGTPCDYRVIDSNEAGDRFVNAERDQYVGRLASELGIDVAQRLPVLLEVTRSGKHLSYGSQIDGSNRFTNSIIYPTSKDEIVVLISDTTDIRKANEALNRNEKMLRSIFDNIPVGVELYDNDGNLVDVNNKDLEIFGVADKKSLVGLSFYDNPIVPLDIIDGVRRGEEQSFRLDYPFEQIGDYYNSSKSGFIQVYTTTSNIYDMNGNRTNFMLINIDNTEINRAHSQLAEFESSFSLVSRFGLVGYCRYDIHAKHGYAIPQWYVNLGETPDTPISDIVGHYTRVEESDREILCEALQSIKDGSIENFSLDVRVTSASGRKSWTRTNVMRNPMNTDPSKVEVVAVNYDITELKKTEQSLIEEKNKAQVSDRLKSAFLANMSHEIRTPLNAIVGFSNLMMSTYDPTEQQEYTRIIEDNNNLLLKLISDILDLSKIEAGTFEFNHGVVDVNRMCEETIRSLNIKVQERPVELLFGHHEAQCCIIGDKNRLIQVVTNFINNAIKFTDKGTITLAYHIEGDKIRFDVTDTGRGIDPAQQASVFNRFVKLNSFAQGTGLGLSICKSIVEQMHGDIGVTSEVGKGSCFWFRVPIGNIDMLIKEAEDDDSTQMEHDGKKRRLLVAEDTDSNFLLLSLMLRKEYDIIRAVNGEEAVEICSQSPPDAILMDVKMPKMDGLEATRLIRQTHTKIPIIAVTAFTQECDRHKALQAGCNDYLSKPVTGDLLRQRLRRFTQRNVQ